MISLDIRYWPLAAFQNCRSMSAFGGKADMPSRQGTKSKGVRPLFQNTEARTVEGFSPVAPLDVFGSHNWNSMRELPLYHRNGGGTRAEQWRMISATWRTLKDVVLSFISDEALTRGAAIAFYTATSIAPVLLIVIAIAGLVFRQEAAQNAITSQFSDLMGHQTAEVLQSAIASAAEKSSGIIATIIGVAVLIATASGVFGEMQAALNAIWKATPQTTTVSQLIRARAVSLGLVTALGFLWVVRISLLQECYNRAALDPQEREQAPILSQSPPAPREVGATCSSVKNRGRTRNLKSAAPIPRPSKRGRG
jgi:hypothetical protein